MSKKKLMNWLRAVFSFQQVCEIEECRRKAEYCVSQFHGRSIRVCSEHFQDTDLIKEVLK